MALLQSKRSGEVGKYIFYADTANRRMYWMYHSIRRTHALEIIQHLKTTLQMSRYNLLNTMASFPKHPIFEVSIQTFSGYYREPS